MRHFDLSQITKLAIQTEPNPVDSKKLDNFKKGTRTSTDAVVNEAPCKLLHKNTLILLSPFFLTFLFSKTRLESRVGAAASAVRVLYKCS